MSSKDVAHPDPTAVLDTVAKFFRTMTKAGASMEAFVPPMQSVTKRQNLVHFLSLGCPKVDGSGVIDTTPTSQDLAKLILGLDFLSPEEIATARGLVYSDEQLEAFEASFPGIEQIAWCKGNGYLLLPNPPKAMSLLEVRDLDRQLFITPEGGWYSEQAFARNDKTTAGGWLAVRKDYYPQSLNLKWKDQQKLVVSPEYVLNAGEVTWALTTYAVVRNVRLLPNLYARTSSVGSSGDHVSVGRFDAEGLVVNDGWDDGRYSYLGVASARKF